MTPTAPSIPSPSSLSWNGTGPAAAPLEHLGVIRAQGPDAASFLQGQLSNDVVLLQPGQARLAAYCTAKGRALATFIVYKEPAGEDGAPGDLLLLCSRDLLPATLKRLSMFVLRAKVKLTDATSQVAVHGVIGTPALPTAEQKDLDETPWSGLPLANGAAIRLYPAAGLPRMLVLSWSEDRQSPAPRPAFSEPNLPALGLQEWLALDAVSGVATLSAPLVDQLVPQMLNYESIGGISFKKGCYPGQEIIARSQFRGTLKRRLYVATAAQPLQAGQDVLIGQDAEQVTGVVVQAASWPGAEYGVALISMQISSRQSPEGLFVQAPDGQGFVALEVDDAPYKLLEDI